MLVLAQRHEAEAWPTNEPAAAEQYVRNFLTQQLGYPLLVPEQADNDPEECIRKGVSIGDVGKLSSGGHFVRFFNIYEPVDGPSQSCGVMPDGFENLGIDNVDVGHKYGKNSVIISKGSGHHLEGFAEFQEGKQNFFRYKPSAPDGAILFLPDGAISEDLEDPPALLPYIQKHALNWCERFHREPLYLVTGRTMTTGLWANACFSSPKDAPVRQGLPDIEMSCAFAAWEDNGQRYCRSHWECSRSATCRYGSKQFDPVDIRNQCIFVRGYAISAQNHALPEGFVLLDEEEEEEAMVGEDEGEWEDTFVIESIGDWPAPYHLSKDINDRLLAAHPQAQIAIAHDDQWCSVIQESDITFPHEDYARRIDDKYEATTECGCVFLRPREKLATDNDTQDRQ